MFCCVSYIVFAGQSRFTSAIVRVRPKFASHLYVRPNTLQCVHRTIHPNVPNPLTSTIMSICRFYVFPSRAVWAAVRAGFTACLLHVIFMQTSNLGTWQSTRPEIRLWNQSVSWTYILSLFNYVPAMGMFLRKSLSKKILPANSKNIAIKYIAIILCRSTRMNIFVMFFS